MERERWRIQQVQAITATALEAGSYDGQSSNRIRPVPDARTIRYYTTLGLLDPPAEMQGRTAFYNKRHVMQLVCIKRLQASGLSLAQVQQRLAGATTKKLATIAALPNDFWDRQHVKSGAPSVKPRRSGPTSVAQQSSNVPRETFWADPASPAASVPARPAMNPTTCLRIPISANVSLEIQGVSIDELTDESLQSLRPLLRQLSGQLENLGLITGVSSAPQSPSAQQESHDDEHTSSI